VLGLKDVDLVRRRDRDRDRERGRGREEGSNKAKLSRVCKKKEKGRKSGRWWCVFCRQRNGRR
jgi:hypothetical protein